MSADALLEQPRRRFERLCQQVTAAVNAAPAGAVINASEEKGRDLFAGLRRATFQAAAQLRLDAAQAAFHPPLHPQTAKPLQNKGRDERTVLTVNGRISLSRRHYAAGVGSSYPLDLWLDRAEDSPSLGPREMACRLDLASRNFDKAVENLGRAAQVHLSGEFLRQVVESEGKAVQAAAKAGQLPIDWKASECPALDKEGNRESRPRDYRSGCHQERTAWTDPQSMW